MSHASPSNAILDAWDVTKAGKGGAAAIYDSSREVVRTFSDLEAEAREIERMLLPLPSKAVVAVQIGNDPRWPALLLALWRRELVPLPLGSHVEAAELRAILETCAVTAVVGVAAEKLSLEMVNAGAGAPVWDSPPPDFLKLTSGTTSAPRALRFRAHQLIADCENICLTMGITEHDLNFGAIPFSHSYGFSNLLTPLLCRGVPLVATHDRMPRAILEGLDRTGATVFPGMPVFFEKLANLPNVAKLSSLRLCISAGAPLTAAVGVQFTQVFGVKIHTFYGASECGGIAYDRSDETDYEDGFGGTPMLGVKIKPEKGEGGQRIVVRSAAVADGYFPQEDIDAVAEGRFIPGDLVEWRTRGMYIVGRATDVINIAGRKLHPGEIEAQIAAFPGVRQVVVFGVPSAIRGEEPVACVAGEGIDRTALLRYCQLKLSTWQMPRDFWLLDEIPTNDRGKTSRRALAEQYQTRPGKGAT